MDDLSSTISHYNEQDTATSQLPSPTPYQNSVSKPLPNSTHKLNVIIRNGQLKADLANF